MRKGHTSLTALLVATARAFATRTGAALVNPQDVSAERLLPMPIGLSLRALTATRVGELLAPAVVTATLGMIDHLALRSAMIDRLVCDLVQREIRQLVIVGAGLDTRVYRLQALHDVAVFEVDHPDSQREKRKRIGELAVMAKSLRHVAIDLTQHSLQTELRRAGHRAEQPTLWLAEGLLPYLERGAIAEMFGTLGALSSPGSSLIVTYVTPDLVWLRRARTLLRGVLAAIGEPFQEPLTPTDVRTLLHSSGFDVEQDSDTRDWAKTLCPNARRAPVFTYERLALATRSAR